jgi:hypothetical protein
MSRAEVLPLADRLMTPTWAAPAPPDPEPVGGGADADQIAGAVVELAVEELCRSRGRGVDDELRALEAVARVAARLVAPRRPERRGTGAGVDADLPVPAAGWWSLTAQMPEVDPQAR